MFVTLCLCEHQDGPKPDRQKGPELKHQQGSELNRHQGPMLGHQRRNSFHYTSWSFLEGVVMLSDAVYCRHPATVWRWRCQDSWSCGRLLSPVIFSSLLFGPLLYSFVGLRASRSVRDTGHVTSLFN